MSWQQRNREIQNNSNRQKQTHRPRFKPGGGRTEQPEVNDPLTDDDIVNSSFGKRAAGTKSKPVETSQTQSTSTVDPNSQGSRFRAQIDANLARFEDSLPTQELKNQLDRHRTSINRYKDALGNSNLVRAGEAEGSITIVSEQLRQLNRHTIEASARLSDACDTQLRDFAERNNLGDAANEAINALRNQGQTTVNNFSKNRIGLDSNRRDRTGFTGWYPRTNIQVNDRNGTLRIPNTRESRDSTLEAVRDLYQQRQDLGQNQRLNPAIERSIRGRITRIAGVDQPKVNSIPGVHADVKSVNNLLNKIDATKTALMEALREQHKNNPELPQLEQELNDLFESFKEPNKIHLMVINLQHGNEVESTDIGKPKPGCGHCRAILQNTGYNINVASN